MPDGFSHRAPLTEPHRCSPDRYAQVCDTRHAFLVAFDAWLLGDDPDRDDVALEREGTDSALGQLVRLRLAWAVP